MMRARVRMRVRVGVWEALDVRWCWSSCPGWRGWWVLVVWVAGFNC